MSRGNILVVDDEQDILDVVEHNLTREGFTVTTASSGTEALETAGRNQFDLILLDLMLPDLDGFSVCRELKQNRYTQPVPIVMLTAKGAESDIITGLELGADDYIVKPFSIKVLIARIRTILRRNMKKTSGTDPVIKVHNISIDSVKFEVRVDNSKIDLTSTEFSILQYLAGHPGWVFTRTQILDSIKGSDYPATDRTIDVQIVSIRKKLGSAGSLIQTVRGVGYRFKDE